MKTFVVTITLATMVLFSACKPEFEPVNYGHDACMHCKMTIIDKRFAAEIVTGKGKAYKFDDVACLRKYLKEQNLQQEGLMVFVADYDHPEGQFLNARHAVYLHNELFASPMTGDFAAFPLAENARHLMDSLHTGSIKWENLD